MWKSLFLGAVLAVLPPMTALAQEPQQESRCEQRTKVINYLAKKYREALVMSAVADPNGLAEILTTDNGTTWSIILSNPNKVSCLISNGKNLKIGNFGPIIVVFDGVLGIKNLVAIGNIRDGQVLIVVTNGKLEWFMSSIDPQTGKGKSFLKGSGWQKRKAMPIDPEA